MQWRLSWSIRATLRWNVRQRWASDDHHLSVGVLTHGFLRCGLVLEVERHDAIDVLRSLYADEVADELSVDDTHLTRLSCDIMIEYFILINYENRMVP